ncbi:hypothetical protein ACJX0J_038981, partial [Zea mays]
IVDFTTLSYPTTSTKCTFSVVKPASAKAFSKGLLTRMPLQHCRLSPRFFCYCLVGGSHERCCAFWEGHHHAQLEVVRDHNGERGGVVAIGECGLDYDRLQFCPADMQKKYFEKQFELSEAVKLPMFLHMRAAGEDFCEIMTQNLHRFPVGVTHSFTDLAEDWDRLLSFENMFIGVNGCSLKTNENLEVLRGIPVERLMIETDSPYCDIINTHARSPYVKSVWPFKKKEKYEPDSTVKGRNEPCLV